MLQPFDKAFNAAVLTMANKVCPTGYDVSDNAPDTYETLRQHVETTGRIEVWNGASEATVFGDAEINWAFRAWHDWTHYTYEFPFGYEGERATAIQQITDLYKVYGVTPQSQRWARMIWIEVVEQAAVYERTGEFVADQRAFMAKRISA